MYSLNIIAGVKAQGLVYQVLGREKVEIITLANIFLVGFTQIST